MDFGVVGMDMDCLMGPETREEEAHSHVVSGPETKPGHDNGSGLSFKQQRSWPVEDDWRVSKMPKPDDMSSPRTMPLPQLLMRSTSLAPPRQEQMLSFSSNKSEVTFLSKDGGSSDFAYYQRMPTPSSAYARNAAYGSGSLNANMHGSYAAVRGPFTPSQWIELEHQALIYKYLNANAPVPSNLLIPLKKALYPYGLSGSSPNSLAWGSFHLGYSGNADPEPGRCRRTDGKKWRCSRDAVADQKYCERHINRGRHRSRKPVEGQTGHGASGRANSKAVAPPVTASMSTSVSGVSQQQLKSLEPPPPADAAAATAANSSVDVFANRMQDPQGIPVMSASSMKPESNSSSFNIPKQDFPMEESSQSEFGLVSTDSLLNPSHRNSYIPKDFGGSFLDFTDQETQDQNPLHQFIDDWPKDQSSQSVVTWPDDIKSDWTQLSMSIPMASDFSSSSSSPTQDKLGLSPLRLSREFEPTQNLGVSNDHSEPTEKQANWVPIPWRTSMGGPLGEVLTNTSSCVNSKNSSSSNTSPLNLLNEGWDGSSQLESSPTGVLQKSTFCSLSNSSSGSSPRAENKKSHDGASLYDDVLGSTLASSSVPTL